MSPLYQFFLPTSSFFLLFFLVAPSWNTRSTSRFRPALGPTSPMRPLGEPHQKSATPTSSFLTPFSGDRTSGPKWESSSGDNKLGPDTTERLQAWVFFFPFLVRSPFFFFWKALLDPWNIAVVLQRAVPSSPSPAVTIRARRLDVMVPCPFLYFPFRVFPIFPFDLQDPRLGFQMWPQ